MSDQFPLINPPRQNEDAAILHRPTDRTNVGYFQRKVVAKLLAKLNNTLQDAAVHIATAPQLYDAPMPTTRLLFLFGCGGGTGSARTWSNEDHENFIIRRKKIFERWRRTCPQMPMSICERVCQQEMSLEQIRLQECFRHGEALALLQHGLNEYAIAAGWGDQIGG